MTRGESKGFDWWGPHDHATRRARTVFSLLVGALAAYAAVVIMIVVACLRLAEIGPWRRLANASDTLGPWGLAALVVMLYLVAAAVIAVVAWGGFSRKIRRYAGARSPADGEVDHVRSLIDTFVLARGIPAPSVGIVDDPAPNGFAFGRARKGSVCLTTGALQLPAVELDALLAGLVTSLTMPAYVYAISAADLLLICAFATNTLWATALFVLFSSMAGVPGVVVGVALFGIAAVVALTRPLLIVADRMLPPLLGDVSELCDLEAVRCTALPDALGALLVHLLEDRRRVRSRVEIAHLWFERDIEEVESRLRRSDIGELFNAWSLTDSGRIIRRGDRSSQRELAARAAVAIELAGGDTALSARLERAAKRAARSR
jgi:heat shock protein HtpX